MPKLFSAFTLTLAFGLLLSATAINTVRAEVYKQVNPDGSVEFTDVRKNEDDAPVPLQPMSTFKATPAPAISNSQNNKPASTKYTSISITNPTNEATIRDNTGALSVAVSVTPSLHSDHKLVLLVDGVQKGESSSGTYALSNLDRGAHTLTAQIQDAEGKTLISAEPVTVYLYRTSGFLKPPPPNPGSPANNGRIQSAPRMPMAPRAPAAP